MADIATLYRPATLYSRNCSSRRSRDSRWRLQHKAPIPLTIRSLRLLITSGVFEVKRCFRSDHVAPIADSVTFKERVPGNEVTHISVCNSFTLGQP